MISDDEDHDGTAAAILAGAIMACGAAAPAPAGAATEHPAPGASAPARHAQSPSAAEIAAQLKAAGLPVSALITYTAVTDPNHLFGRRGEYTSKVAWQDPRAIAAGAGQPAASDLGGIEYGAASRRSAAWPQPRSAWPT